MRAVAICVFCAVVVTLHRVTCNPDATKPYSRKLRGVPAINSLIVPPQETTDTMYHKGSVLSNSTTVHVILYGMNSDWSTRCIDALQLFFKGLRHSEKSTAPSLQDWWNILAEYTDAHGRRATTSVTLGTIISQNSSIQTVLQVADVEDIIQNHLENKALPVSSRDVYFVLTSPDILVPDGEEMFRRLHSYMPYKDSQIMYGFVAAPIPELPKQPHHFFEGYGRIYHYEVWFTAFGDYEMNMVVNSFSHALAGTITNPYGSGWHVGKLDNYNSWRDLSNLCVINFGDIYTAGKGGKYGRKYNLVGVDNSKYLLEIFYSRFEKGCVGPTKNVLASMIQKTGEILVT